jgi:hypothetical protein
MDERMEFISPGSADRSLKAPKPVIPEEQHAGGACRAPQVLANGKMLCGDTTDH